MKLFKKSVVASEAAEQKRRQIDEGIAIARKVDALRETLASLEKQQSEFIRGTETELKAKAANLIDGIARMEWEISQLEERRKSLISPLDGEWIKVSREKNLVEAQKDDLARKLAEAEESNSEAEDKYANAKSVLAKVKVRERELEKAYSDASAAKSEAEKSKERKLMKEKVSDERIAEKDQELLSREAGIAAKERENQIEKERLERENREIIRTRAQLEDQRGTLERAMKRLTK